MALEARHAVHNNDHTMEVRAWKLFFLLPFLLLRKARGVGKDELSRRFDKFSEGQWRTLFEEARRAVQMDCPRVASMTPERMAQAACQKVRLGEVSRARQCLTGAALAPGNEDTFRALQDRRTQQVVRPLTQDVLESEPEVPVELDRATFLTSLKSAARGSSSGPQHLKVLLDECDTMTALAKPDGGVRGIATGSSVRRLVGRTLAKQFTKVFEAECAPFQYALSTRAGTDCIGHMVMVATDRDANLAILSVDGIGAYDHIFRSSMLGRLKNMPKARATLPFVRLSDAQPSRHSWVDGTVEPSPKQKVGSKATR